MAISPRSKVAFHMARLAFTVGIADYIIHRSIFAAFAVVLISGVIQFFYQQYKKWYVPTGDVALKSLYNIVNWMNKTGIPEPNWDNREEVVAKLTALRSDPNTPEKEKSLLALFTGNLPDSFLSAMGERRQMFKTLLPESYLKH